MVQTMRDLFRHSERVKETDRLQIRVTVSFLEVYNENIRDLLSNDYADPAVGKEAPEFLDLREDPIKGPVAAGITEVEASTPEEVMALLQRGNARRSQHATAANEVSSRSHAVLQIIVETRENAEGTAAQINIGKLSLVDLAGSERAANTKNRGDRLKEGANINRSLLTLGNCASLLSLSLSLDTIAGINALGEKASRGQFVPYRDSKLTRLLKDSLGGNCRTVMIANISAASTSFEETLNTLKYANRAKNIKTNVQRNVLEVNHHISEYVTLIQNLRSEVTALKQQLANSSSMSTLPHPPCSFVNEDDFGRPAALEPKPRDGLSPRQMGLQTPSTDKAVLKEMKAWMQENFRERMQLRRTLIELEDKNLQNSIEIGKRQILVADWNASRIHTPKGLQQDEAQNHADQIAALMEKSPADVRAAYHECEQLRKAIDKNHATKKSISKRLRENERQAEQFHKDLRENRRVTGEERRELLELMYRIGNLELGNMQLEQAQVIHDSVVKGKDLTIQKLQLQVLMRDKVIAKQKEVLKSHSIDCNVGNIGLLLMEDRAISQNFDAIRATTPATTPVLRDGVMARSHSGVWLNNNNNVASSGGSPSRVVLVRERKSAESLPNKADHDTDDQLLRDSEARRRDSSPTPTSHNPQRKYEDASSNNNNLSGRRDWMSSRHAAVAGSEDQRQRFWGGLGISGHAALQGSGNHHHHHRSGGVETLPVDEDGSSHSSHTKSVSQADYHHHRMGSPAPTNASTNNEARRRRPRPSETYYGAPSTVSAFNRTTANTGDTSNESDIEGHAQHLGADDSSLLHALRVAPRVSRKRSHLSKHRADRQGRRRPPLKQQPTVFESSATNSLSGGQFAAAGLSARNALATGSNHQVATQEQGTATLSIRRTKRRSMLRKNHDVHYQQRDLLNGTLLPGAVVDNNNKVYPYNDSIAVGAVAPAEAVPTTHRRGSDADTDDTFDLEIQGIHQHTSSRPPLPPKSLGIASLRSKLAQRSGHSATVESKASDVSDADSSNAPSIAEGSAALAAAVAASDLGRDSIDALLSMAAAPAAASLAG